MAVEGSLQGYESVHRLLSENLPPQLFQEVNRILLGYNGGKAVDMLSLPALVIEEARSQNFDVQAYRFSAAEEQLRKPRIVRIGLIQNAIVLPTTEPYERQMTAIRDRLRILISAAGEAGVNVLCLQEAWTMPFAFCTREKGWCELAESAEHGTSTKFILELARKYNMVIVSPILERDHAHGDILWNTAVIVGNHGNIIGKHRKVISFPDKQNYSLWFVRCSGRVV